MITIPLALRTVAGLDRMETKAIVFIVQEWRLLEVKSKKSPYIRFPPVDTNHVTKHLKVKHPETMKIIARFRRQGWLRLRTRNSAGPTGHGWDGALFGELTPSEQAIKLVVQYLEE